MSRVLVVGMYEAVFQIQHIAFGVVARTLTPAFGVVSEVAVNLRVGDAVIVLEIADDATKSGVLKDGGSTFGCAVLPVGVRVGSRVSHHGDAHTHLTVPGGVWTGNAQVLHLVDEDASIDLVGVVRDHEVVAKGGPTVCGSGTVEHPGLVVGDLFEPRIDTVASDVSRVADLEPGPAGELVNDNVADTPGPMRSRWTSASSMCVVGVDEPVVMDMVRDIHDPHAIGSGQIDIPVVVGVGSLDMGEGRGPVCRCGGGRGDPDGRVWIG